MATRCTTTPGDTSTDAEHLLMRAGGPSQFFVCEDLAGCPTLVCPVGDCFRGVSLMSGIIRALDYQPPAPEAVQPGPPASAMPQLPALAVEAVGLT